MRHDLPSVLELMEIPGEPRVHPNGFIQFDLDEVYRLHVWHPELPYRQKTYHPVHDHVFGFNSHVYTGRLVNVQYDLVTDAYGTHVVWQVQATEGHQESVLKPKNGKRVRLIQHDAEAIQAGESYDFAAYTFHEILFNEPTLTVIKKRMASGHDARTGVNSQGASVVVPVGVAPDNDFRRDAVDTGTLWELIGDAYP